MEPQVQHNWPDRQPDALRVQAELAGRVRILPYPAGPRLIAAVDTAYGRKGETLYVAVVVTTIPDMLIVERTCHSGSLRFPYIPGLFYFREGPVITQALAGINSHPDLLIVHGHGLAHPRQCGMACCIGVVFDIPTIGCARKLLAGTHDHLPPQADSSRPICVDAQQVGAVYRSRANVKPIYISPAHRCDLASATRIIAGCLRGYRLPEPLRLAHLFANKYRRRIERQRASAAGVGGAAS